jgi:hypothetical protein
MEVEAEPVWCDDKEDLELLPISLIDPPVRGPNSIRLKFVPCAVNVRNQNCRAILSGIAAVDRKSDLHVVSREDHRWMWMIPALDFGQPKGFRVPPGGGIEVCDGQGEHILLVRERCFEQSCIWHWTPLFAVEDRFIMVTSAGSDDAPLVPCRRARLPRQIRFSVAQ